MRRVGFAALAGLALVGCDAGGKNSVLQGYAEADYLYLSPREPGVVQVLAVKEGDEVKRGALIFALDENRAKAGVDRAQAQRSAAGRNVGALDQAVAEANASAALARANLSRTRALFKDGFVSKARLDQDLAAMDAASARVRQAQAERSAASGQTDAASADVALAREQADDRVVRAPQGGRVERVFRRPGELAGAGDPVIALLPPENIKLRFFAPQGMLPRLTLGGSVGISCDGCAEGLTAKVSFIATEPQFTPPVIYSLEQREKLVYLVEARPDQPEAMRPGQPVDVSVAP